MAARGLILYAVDSLGNAVKVLADPDGTLRVDGTVSLSGTVDVSDRANRLVGIVYGNLSQLLQRATTLDLIVQLRNAGVEIDPRQTRLLTSSDVISAVQSGAWSVGVNNFPSTYDVSDRAARLLGIVYGSQSQQLLQRASTYDLIVQLRSAGAEIDPRSIRALAKATDEIYSVLRTDAGVAYDARDRSWTITENLNRAWALAKATDNVYAVLKTDAGVAIDPRDRNWTITESLNRNWTLGSSDIVTAYGSQTQALLQRASTYDLIVQLRSAGVEIDPRSIRALAKATDEVYSVLRTDAGVVYDARDRSWTITENLNRSWNLGASDVPDLSDRAARLLGVVYGSQSQQLQQRASTYELLAWVNNFPSTYDVSDRAARLLGVVYGSQGQQLQQKATTYELLVDEVDRAARLLGIVYGSQSQQLKQTSTNYNLAVELVTGATLYDARQIRALTSSDVVDIVDKAARLLGVVYGSQAQQLLQRATTYDLIVQLRTAGTEYDARQIRNLTAATDVLSAYVKEPAGTNVDPRSIRALTSSDVVTANQSNRSALLMKPEREDIISLGGVASPNNAGVQIVAGTGGQKIKVYDAGFHAAVGPGLHYFYFGTSTAPTAAVFCTIATAGLIHKTFVQPRISAAGDNLYIFSSVSETNMPYDLGYVKEA